MQKLRRRGNICFSDAVVAVVVVMVVVVWVMKDRKQSWDILRSPILVCCIQDNELCYLWTRRRAETSSFKSICRYSDERLYKT